MKPTRTGVKILVLVFLVSMVCLSQVSPGKNGPLSALVLGTNSIGKAIAASLQGTDTNVLTSGTVSNSTGVTLCTDANHGATTSGCSAGNTIESHTASSSGELDFTTCLPDASHTIFEINMWDLELSAGAYFFIEFHSGGSYDTGSHYSNNGIISIAGNGTGAFAIPGSTAGADPQLSPSNTMGTGSGTGMSGALRLYNPASTTKGQILQGQITGLASDQARTVLDFVRYVPASPAAIDGFRFKPSSGNFVTGTITCVAVQ